MSLLPYYGLYVQNAQNERTNRKAHMSLLLHVLSQKLFDLFKYFGIILYV